MYLRVLHTALSAAYLLAALPALADDLPTAAAIRAHVEAAKGPGLASYRETIEETRCGERYRTVSVHRGGDYRESVENGPARTASGRYGGQRWRQNENGETILEGPESTAIDEITYAESVQRIADPVDGYLVASIDSAGNGTKQYVENGALGDRFVIDTGASASMVIFQKFARRNQSALVGEAGADVPNEQRMRGVGGEFVTKPIQLAKMTFGPVNFTDFLALLVTQRGAYDSADDGVVGAQFLHIFDVTFDYAHGKAYFVFHS